MQGELRERPRGGGPARPVPGLCEAPLSPRPGKALVPGAGFATGQKGLCFVWRCSAWCCFVLRRGAARPGGAAGCRQRSRGRRGRRCAAVTLWGLGRGAGSRGARGQRQPVPAPGRAAARALVPQPRPWVAGRWAASPVGRQRPCLGPGCARNPSPLWLLACPGREVGALLQQPGRRVRKRPAGKAVEMRGCRESPERPPCGSRAGPAASVSPWAPGGSSPCVCAAPGPAPRALRSAPVAPGLCAGCCWACAWTPSRRPGSKV